MTAEPIGYAHVAGSRPVVAVAPGAAPRLSRAELEAATKGRLAAGPRTAGIIDRLVTINTAMQVSSPDDAAAMEAEIPFLMRQLGLYPVYAAEGT